MEILDDYYKKTGIAQRYFKYKTGEDLEKEVARKRWDMTRNPDPLMLKKVIKDIAKEQVKKIK